MTFASRHFAQNEVPRNERAPGSLCPIPCTKKHQPDAQMPLNPSAGTGVNDAKLSRVMSGRFEFQRLIR